MKQPLKPKQVVGLLLAAILFVIGIAGVRDAFRLNGKNRAAAAAEPLSMPIDLSRPGLYTGEMRQSFSHTCKQVFWVEGDVSDAHATSLEASLLGLKGWLTVSSDSKGEVFSAPFDHETLVSTLNTASVLMWHPGIRRSPLAVGNYRIKLTVEHGSPGFAGKPQQLLSRYELCGIERLQVRFAGLFGGAALFLSVCLGVIVLRSVLRVSR